MENGHEPRHHFCPGDRDRIPSGAVPQTAGPLPAAISPGGRLASKRSSLRTRWALRLGESCRLRTEAPPAASGGTPPPSDPRERSVPPKPNPARELPTARKDWLVGRPESPVANPVRQRDRPAPSAGGTLFPRAQQPLRAPTGPAIEGPRDGARLSLIRAAHSPVLRQSCEPGLSRQAVEHPPSRTARRSDLR